jgi:hypothetical protein
MSALSCMSTTAQVALLVEHPMHWLNERVESVSSPHLAQLTSSDALPLKPVMEPSLCSRTCTSAAFKLTVLKSIIPLCGDLIEKTGSPHDEPAPDKHSTTL